MRSEKVSINSAQDCRNSRRQTDNLFRATLVFFDNITRTARVNDNTVETYRTVHIETIVLGDGTLKGDDISQMLHFLEIWLEQVRDQNGSDGSRIYSVRPSKLVEIEPVTPFSTERDESPTILELKGPSRVVVGAHDAELRPNLIL
jgi:hypothetical protein